LYTLGVKADILTTFSCRPCRNPESPTLLEPQGPGQAWNGAPSCPIDAVIVVTTLQQYMKRFLKYPQVFVGGGDLFTDKCRLIEGGDLFSRWHVATHVEEKVNNT